MCGEPYKHAAALLVSEVLHKHPEHEGALLEYVRIVLDRGLTADAMRILLRLLVNNHERTAVRHACNLILLLLQLYTCRSICQMCPHQSILHQTTDSQPRKSGSLSCAFHVCCRLAARNPACLSKRGYCIALR